MHYLELLQVWAADAAAGDSDVIIFARKHDHIPLGRRKTHGPGNVGHCRHNVATVDIGVWVSCTYPAENMYIFNVGVEQTSGIAAFSSKRGLPGRVCSTFFEGVESTLSA